MGTPIGHRFQPPVRKPPAWRLYGGRFLSGLQATEPELRRVLGSARVLHLATHGRYHRDDVLLSGLILTQPATGNSVTEATDGVLEAAELLDPQIQVRAEVVVLSGCETARGVPSFGEGLVGLTRAWQIAGARSVVASQWSIADASTARLMRRFHERLKAGLTKDEALRRAMVALADRPGTSHPFFWAAFLITGDPRPMSGSSTPRVPKFGPRRLRRKAEDKRAAGSARCRIPLPCVLGSSGQGHASARSTGPVGPWSHAFRTIAPSPKWHRSTSSSSAMERSTPARPR